MFFSRAEKRTNGAEKRTNGAEKRTNGAEKRTNGAEKRKCTLGPPYIPTGQSPMIRSDLSPNNRVGICVLAFQPAPLHAQVGESSGNVVKGGSYTFRLTHMAC